MERQALRESMTRSTLDNSGQTPQSLFRTTQGRCGSTADAGRTSCYSRIVDIDKRWRTLVPCCLPSRSRYRSGGMTQAAITCPSVATQQMTTPAS